MKLIANKIFNLLRQRDFQSFIFFFIKHPKRAYSSNQHLKNPEYLTDYLTEIEKYNTSLVFPFVEKDYIKDYIIEKKSNCLWDINLASFELKKVNIYKIDWLQTFPDDEDTSALHRFIWLYNEVTKRIVKKTVNDSFKNDVLFIINSWRNTIERKQILELHDEVWHTYAVAERVINWCFCFLRLGVDIENFPGILQSLKKQLYYISTHLEYYGDNFTGNHLSNSGRALYIGGIVTGVVCYINAGKKILMEEFKRIIVDNYFLREGSIHYQFLVTKNYCDVLYIAKLYNDYSFISQVSENLRKLLIGCQYFIIKQNGQWSIPKIGDISPDYPPEWIIGVPWVAKYLLNNNTFTEVPNTLGYHSLFITLDTSSTKNIKNIADNITTRDWCRITRNGFNAFFHVNNTLYPNNLPGHFHHDSGSFVLLYKDTPVFVDIGRCSYTNDLKSKMDKSCYGHNMLVIDNENPEIDMHTFYSVDFINNYVNESPQIILLKNNEICIENNGYKRLKNIIDVARTVSVEDDKLTIVDNVYGRKKHNIKILFHTPLNVKIQVDGNLLLYNESLSFILSKKSNMLNIKIYSDEQAEFYGDKKKITTIMLHGIIDLPISSLISIEKN